jgi:hypothetical protein
MPPCAALPRLMLPTRHERLLPPLQPLLASNWRRTSRAISALADAQRRLQEADAATHVPGGDDSTTPEADDIASLHAQALGILNVRALVPVVLDLDTLSFSRWRRLILLVLDKYALVDHVLSDVARPDVPHWTRMDSHVLSWLYTAITIDLYDIVTTSAPTARTTWLALEQQFVGNVDTEFRNLNQGTLSIIDYCRKMKTLADSLVELGEPVTDHVLTLNVLRGLYERFEYIRSFLKRQRPLSKFVEVCSELLLEELSMAPPSVAPTAPTTALIASAPAPSPCSTSSSAGGGGGGNRRRCCKTDGSCK